MWHVLSKSQDFLLYLLVFSEVTDKYSIKDYKASQNYRGIKHTSFSSPIDFLREDTMIGTSFLRVAAHDDDFGTNAAVTYSMSSEQPEYLRVNPLTGWVFVNQPISQVTLCAEMHTDDTKPLLGQLHDTVYVPVYREAKSLPLRCPPCHLISEKKYVR